MSRMRSSVVALVVVAIAATALAGCGRRGLIRVNGEKIQWKDFCSRLERTTVQTPQGPQLAGRYVVQQLIQEELIRQLAKQEKVEPTEEQINKKIELFKKQTGGDMARILGQMGMTLDDLKRQIAVEQAYINVVTKGITIPEEKVRKAYNEALRAKDSPFVRPEQVLVSAIITNSKAKIDKASKLLASGQEFGTVSRKLSDVWVKQTDGKLGWASRDGMIDLVVGRKAGLPKEFANRIFSLQIGKYTAPFESVSTIQQGDRTVTVKQWVILRADQKRQKRITTYDEVKDRIRETLAMQEGARRKEVQKKMQMFAKNADIVINSAIYKDIGERIKEEAGKALEAAKPGAAPLGPTPAVP
ncbi:MAG: peptidyl-prolyl cis-trans isomerase [Armatimonadota bacterium]